MNNCKRINIIGLIAICCINILVIFRSVYWLYQYNFTEQLFLYKQPNIILIVDAILGSFGLLMLVLLYRKIIGSKLFLMVIFMIWGIVITFFFLL